MHLMTAFNIFGRDFSRWPWRGKNTPTPYRILGNCAVSDKAVMTEKKILNKDKYLNYHFTQPNCFS